MDSSRRTKALRLRGFRGRKGLVARMKGGKQGQVTSCVKVQRRSWKAFEPSDLGEISQSLNDLTASEFPSSIYNQKQPDDPISLPISELPSYCCDGFESLAPNPPTEPVPSIPVVPDTLLKVSIPADSHAAVLSPVGPHTALSKDDNEPPNKLSSSTCNASELAAVDASPSPAADHVPLSSFSISHVLLHAGVSPYLASPIHTILHETNTPNAEVIAQELVTIESAVGNSKADDPTFANND